MITYTTTKMTVASRAVTRAVMMTDNKMAVWNVTPAVINNIQCISVSLLFRD